MTAIKDRNNKLIGNKTQAFYFVPNTVAILRN